MKNFIRAFLPALFVLLQVHFAFSQAAALLPNGEQQYFDNNGNPLAGGSVYYYAPNTTIFQTTWQNPNQTIVNTNPVILDGAGRALIYGVGTYRQVVYDASRNLIWDQLTSSGTSSGSNATNFGDGNAVGTIKAWAGTVAPAQYQFANGQQVLRTSFPDLLAAITQVESVICTTGSNVLTALTDTTQIPIGAAVEVSCVPGSSIVTATTNSTVTLSNIATISSGVNATFFPFGNGNGSTTFNIPDLRGYVIAGRDNMGGTAAGRLTSTYYTNNPDSLGASGGSQSTTLTLSEMVGHTHTATVTDPGHSHGLLDTVEFGGTGTLAVTGGGTDTQTGISTTGITVQNSSVGGGVSQSASLNPLGGIPESSNVIIPGSGYPNGMHVLTVVGGTCTTQPQFNVLASGGVIDYITSVADAGNCTVYPTNPAATTVVGSGSGATLNVAFVGTGAVVGTVVTGGTGYPNGTVSLTINGGTCASQPTVSALVSGGAVIGINAIAIANTCTIAPSNPVTLSDGTHTNATANIPFNPGGTAYTNGGRIFTVEGGTCSVQPQFNGTVVNGQVTAVGSQVTASNCSVAPNNPAAVQDAGGVAASATVNAGGSGYNTGSITLSVLGGTCSVQPQFNATVISGTVTAINSLANAGSCTVTPPNPAATNPTAGGGIGATVNVTYTISGSGATFNVIYGPQPFSNIQPTLTLNYVIKVLPDMSLSTTNVVNSINGLSGAWTCGANITCAGHVISGTGGGGGGNLNVGSTPITGGVSGRILQDVGGILSEALTTGTGNTVVFQTSPTLVSPQLGVAQATSINGLTITTTTGSLSVPNGAALTWSGNNNFTATTTGPTSVTFPTSGTLLTTAVTSLPSLTGVGTLTSGATGAGFTLALGTSTLTGQVPVANGGTGIASGTSGGIPYFSSSTSIASSAALTANAPVIGGGAGVAPTVGTRSGNTTTFATATGTLTNGHCVSIDGSGNFVDAGGACTTGGGGGTVAAGTINQLGVYAATGTTISGLATANNGVLITSAGGVPSISSTLPSAVQGNITTVGTITSGVWTGTNIALANGGTNATLTASNGGIIYSTASAMAVLAGTVTANQCLLSGSSSAPSWGSCTSSLTVGTTTIASGTTTRVLFDNAGVLGEYSITGTGNVVMSTSPTITTPTFSGTVTGPSGTWTAANGLSVTGGGTGIQSGTSGGVLYFSGATSIASSGALTANLPVIGGGAGSAPSVGSRSGNTTNFVTATGSLTSGHCAQWDASGNAVDSGSACGAVSSVSNTDGTLTISPTTGAVVASVANMVYPTNDAVSQASMGLGVGALANQTAGSANYSNTAFGYQALNGAITTAGFQNTAVGFKALNANTSGAGNVAIGVNALLLNTTGVGNFAMGTGALASNLSGGNNVAIGGTALNLYTGSSNVAIGRSALALTVTGFNDVAIGFQAGQNATGTNNTFLGANAGTGVSGSTTGGSNVFIGNNAGTAFTTGTVNICIGNTACSTLTTGSGNIIIGAGTAGTVPTATTSSFLNIGGTIQANDVATLELDFNVTTANTTTFAKRTSSIATLMRTVVTGNAGSATITGTAPGAGASAIIAACGTNAGTGALYAGAGTSTTYTKMIDNLGSGVTGC